MQNGIQALSSLDQGVQIIQDQIREIDARIDQENAKLVALQGQQAQRYQRLAKAQLDHIISGELTTELDAAGQRARELLQARDEAQTALVKEIETAHTELSALETRRREPEDRVAHAVAALDDAEAATQKRLEQNPAYQAQLKACQQADRIAEHAEQKTQQSEKTRQRKGKPYEDDPLFSYLWARGYATSKYSANALMRHLDKWVARLCRYQDARPNYAMLLEIPKRLREHAGRVRSVADQAFAKLTQLEEQAASADGIPALEDDLKKAQAALDRMDDEIDQVQARLHALGKRHTRFINGEDEHMEQALELLSGAFEREKLHTLYEYARATQTAEDDVLVQELEAGVRDAIEIKETLEEQKRVRARQLDRLQALANVRRRFKKQRYDSRHSTFSNAAVVAMMLSQFLRGAANSEELWRTIEREQRYRRRESNPDFGSGGFGRRRGTWRTPFPRTGGSGSGGWGGGLGRDGMGGGGFRTGGGF